MKYTQRKIRIGDLLIQKGLINQNQLDQALVQQKQTGNKLGRILISLGFITEDQFLNLLSEQLEIPFIDLRYFHFDKDLVKKLPETYARRFRAIPLLRENDGLVVGMIDPLDIFAFDELHRVLKNNIKPAVVRESELLQTLDLIYRRTEEINTLAEQIEGELQSSDFDITQLTSSSNAADAPVVRLLQTIFEDAIQVRASDIHIEPDEQVIRVRQRIDGVLYEHVLQEKRVASALVLRLKIMASLNIAEKRLPQDGRFSIKVKGRTIDVRLSTMPIQYGESVVMRLLDQSGGIISLDHQGMPQNLLKRFKELIHKPHGMILVTGPTGSGKTTTLYAALQEINQADKKIITIEDPVEYRLPRINQVQVNPKIKLDFITVLRSSLRQDPDVILIGEMRDQETVQVGLRASITGHLVLSTLHTNDAVSSAIRLIDMGAEPYLVGTAVRAIVAQRLVRRICGVCAEHCPLTARETAWLETLKAAPVIDVTVFKKGRGCNRCNNTGYQGRIGVYELLEMDDVLAAFLQRSDSAAFVQAAKQQHQYKPLVKCALEYALQGITSMEEVLKVAAE